MTSSKLLNKLILDGYLFLHLLGCLLTLLDKSLLCNPALFQCSYLYSALTDLFFKSLDPLRLLLNLAPQLKFLLTDIKKVIFLYLQLSVKGFLSRNTLLV